MGRRGHFPGGFGRRLSYTKHKSVVPFLYGGRRRNKYRLLRQEADRGPADSLFVRCSPESKNEGSVWRSFLDRLGTYAVCGDIHFARPDLCRADGRGFLRFAFQPIQQRAFLIAAP